MLFRSTRARTAGLAGTPQTTLVASPADTQGLGITVNAFAREAFFDGITTGGGIASAPAAAQTGIIGPKTVGGTQIINGVGTTLDPRTTITNNGGEDAMYGAIQYFDIYAAPTTVVMPTVAVNSPTGNGGPTAAFGVFNQLGIAQPCTGGTINGFALPGPITAGQFVITQIANTNTFLIQLAATATNTPQVLGPNTFAFSCPGAENISTVTVSGLVITQASQTITFGTLSNKTLGTAPFTVSATASSGLTVSFNSQTTPVCTVSGTTVTLVAAGTCTIQATQAGNTIYAAATPVNQSFQVNAGSAVLQIGRASCRERV